jgi:undecaprenyl-diphosphatase
MDFEQILSLGLLQGLTEFLPVSSSAHLILLPLLLGWEDQRLAFDVAVHVGTLTAVVSYFKKDIVRLIQAWFSSVFQRQHSTDSKLAWYVILATIPVGVFGLLFGDFVESTLRSPVVIAVATIVFGLLLWWSDAVGKRVRVESQLNAKDAITIGFFQVLALIPGTSRSGITMTGGLFLGLTREACARFSFLLSVPLIFLAGSLKTVELVNSTLTIDWFAIISGTVISAISAFICIALFLKTLEKMGMWPFVAYRLVLGTYLLVVYAF